MINCKDFNFSNWVPTYKTKKRGKEVTTYCNDILTLDTEVTNYYILDGKALCFDYSKPPEWYKQTVPQSLLYIWTIGINKTVIYGRTNEELKEFIDKMLNHLSGATAIIYVHNLSYDFNFLQNSLGSECEVFSRQQHKTIYVNYENLQFRCSLFLTNKPLVKAAEEVKAPIKKLVGDLDYNKIRTPYTPLTSLELEYCKNDILCLYYIIENKLKKYNQVYNIPLTQTGQVRRALKSTMYSERDYKRKVKNMWPDFEQFELLHDVFYGGYVHSNARHTNLIIKNVFSYDITSSYPYVLTSMKFPIEKFVRSYEKNLDFLDTEDYSYIVDVTFYGIESKLDNTFLSVHKAMDNDIDGSDIFYRKATIDNGRIKKCKKARYRLTDCDVLIANKAYKFDRVVINNIWTAKKDYLPAQLIAFILKLFGDKTQYKDLDKFESLYKEAKEFINSVYGMFVTKIICDTIEFKNGEWSKTVITEDEANKKLSEMYEQEQICSYSTGVWCAAYARKHLWDMIVKVDRDVVYCDTDSVKFIGEYNIKHFIKDCEEVDRAITRVCDARGLCTEWYKVEKPKGGKAELGYFESDGVYKEFKTLGAKKYAFITESKKVQITIAGVNKKAGAEYFKNLNMFKPGAYLNYKHANKKLVRYNTNQIEFTFPDGFTATEKIGCVLTPTTYLLDITKDYEELINMLEDCDEYMNYNESEGSELLK